MRYNRRQSRIIEDDRSAAESRALKLFLYKTIVIFNAWHCANLPYNNNFNQDTYKS